MSHRNHNLLPVILTIFKSVPLGISHLWIGTGQVFPFFWYMACVLFCLSKPSHLFSSAFNTTLTTVIFPPFCINYSTRKNMCQHTLLFYCMFFSIFIHALLPVFCFIYKIFLPLFLWEFLLEIDFFIYYEKFLKKMMNKLNF